MMSMTGFASKTIMITQHNAYTQLTIILKSLNSRFFETTCKLPFALTHLETDLIKLFKKYLRRGNISFIIQVSNPNFFKGTVQAHIATAQSYIDACKQIKEQLSIAGDLKIEDLIILPNVFAVEETLIDTDTQKIIVTAIHDTLKELVKTRITEGNNLQEDIIKRVTTLKNEIHEIKKTSIEIMDRKKKDVLAKISAIETTGELADSQRSFYYIELDKADIHEEIIRFTSHLETLEAFIKSCDEEKGRRLDFILQELGREINTIAAKSSDARLSSLAINSKVELEKIREQTQNIV